MVQSVMQHATAHVGTDITNGEQLVEQRSHAMFAEVNRPARVNLIGSLLSESLYRLTDPRAAAQTMDFGAHGALQVRARQRGVYFHPSPAEPLFPGTVRTPQDPDHVVAVARGTLARVPESQ